MSRRGRARKEPTVIPEGCTLAAIDTGNGYQLEVRDGKHTIAILEWPASWPEIVSPAYLTVAGFEILPA